MMKWVFAVIGIAVLIGLLRLGELYTQLFRYKAYWDRHNQHVLAKARIENIRYYALGDSAAQGVGATKPDKGYVALVARELESRRGKDVDLVNLSKSGAKIKDAIDQQIPVLNSLGVDNNSVVTIDIGANDILDFEEKRFESEMDNLMGQLPKNTVISTIPSFSGTYRKNLEPNVIRANEIIDRLAKKHGLKLAIFKNNIPKSQWYRSSAADLFHPSSYAYRVNWAETFLSQL